MDLILEILDWAKDKKDLCEIFYEDKASSTPLSVHLVFNGDGTEGASNSRALGFLKSPTIGKISLIAEKTKSGKSILKGDELGYIQGVQEKEPLVAPFSGKILQSLAEDDKSVGYGDPILLVEIAP